MSRFWLFFAYAPIFMVLILSLAPLPSAHGVFLSNLNDTCFRCICEASTGCSAQADCRQSYCGPFSISRAYWMDAGRVVLPNDDPTRWGSFEDCANDYECATNIVNQYMEKYGTDCNSDGLVDCIDYTMLHVNGGPRCQGALGGAFASKFFQCLRSK
ncbi:AGAP000274-PA-like protein [Anopheles sinensis]|uniref:lysozyme n=1 Tax=Anopheles sinensis TaxID=74873 RepID=A0A084VNW1_ANOSI|nr:AGAP000274-PA-like protein [Anopheles sinensis]